MNICEKVEGADGTDGTSLPSNIIKLNLEKFFKVFDVNPFETNTWMDDAPITYDEIVDAIVSDRLQTEPDSEKLNSRKYHIERVAFMVVNKQDRPIDIDVGIPCLNYFPSMPVEDGFHRIAAAMYNGETTIMANYSGQSDWANQFADT